MEKLAERIKKFRELKGLSQKDLAIKIGVSPATVSQYEAKTYFNVSPSVENLIKISQILEVSFEWLATGRGVENIDDYLAHSNNDNLVLLNNNQKQLLAFFNKHPKDWQEKYLTMLQATAKEVANQ
jgi:transcriptional regulator with XRE-family HTH domain